MRLAMSIQKEKYNENSQKIIKFNETERILIGIINTKILEIDQLLLNVKALNREIAKMDWK
jgi:hypothetical protein